jgi:hypothetical protein
MHACTCRNERVSASTQCNCYYFLKVLAVRRIYPSFIQVLLSNKEFPTIINRRLISRDAAAAAKKRKLPSIITNKC